MSEGNPGFLGVSDSIWLSLIKVVLLIMPSLALVPGLIWWERRLLSWMQDRIGPNLSGTFTRKDGKRIFTFGLLQPLLDGVKLFLKEDVTPGGIKKDKAIYFIAPALALFPAFAIGGTLPWGPTVGLDGGPGLIGYLTPLADVEIGLLYVLAISSLGAYGLVLAGYASNNKYSLMGAIRASAQLISYELAMGMALAAIVLATGSLRMSDMVNVQMEAFWGIGGLEWLQNWFIFTPYGFVAAIIFLIALVAETNRAPFDLPEAENELIAGYHTEYSSMKFAVFFMGEYAAMFMLSGVFATVFLGGFNLLPLNFDELAASASGPMVGFFEFLHKTAYWTGPLVFLAKCWGGITFFIWLRATLPRLRYDQLMGLGWKSLLPAAVANFMVVGIWMIGQRLWGTAGGLGAAAAAIAIVVVLYLNIVASSKKANDPLLKRTVDMVDPGSSRTVTMVDTKEA
jgi:NADH-quinone oxidoreductase subunit H